MAHARKLYEVWPEVVSVNTNNLPYDQYRVMAVCALPTEQKADMQGWHAPLRGEFFPDLEKNHNVLIFKLFVATVCACVKQLCCHHIRFSLTTSLRK
jgi:hypothetical protein